MRICLLICGQPITEISHKYGSYQNILTNFLKLSGLEIETYAIDCLSVDFSSLYDNHFDGWIISGSPESVNSSKTWVIELHKLITHLINKREKIVGICFGHQLLVKILGGNVIEKNWCVSSFKTKFNNQGFDIISHILDKELQAEINLYHMHKEVAQSNINIIYLDENNTISYYNKQVLTFQAHPELNMNMIEMLLRSDRYTIPKSIRLDGLDRLSDNKNDQLIISTLICKFFSID